MSQADEEPYLRMRDVSKTFGQVRALKGVSLELRQGEIHSLMGENGAGKSTLMKILSGAYRPDPGSRIAIGGRAVEISNPMAAKTLGISIIYQELSLAANLTVSENIHLGCELRRGALLDRAGMAMATDEILARLGASFAATTKVADLSIAERQLVEIARALHARSRILVMDEPTTALSERETARLFAIVRQLREDGLGIVYISHRMNEIYELSDRVSVLRDGSYVGTLDRHEIDPDRLVRMMVGRDLSSFYTKQHAETALTRNAVLRVRDLSDGRRVKPCSFDVHAGEVLGIAGLVGAGRTELARLIYGADRRVSGTVTLDARPLEARSPGEAIAAGIAYLTEDRKHLGLFLDMSIADNVNLGVVDRDALAGGFLNRRKGRERAQASVASLGIRAASIRQTVGGLSGGNQQKVLLSRLLQTKPRLLILDEPTRGVDIGAKSEIYKVVDDLARSGMAIIVISSELPEIVGICDRVLVMREGEIAGEIAGGPASPITQERIVALATAAARTIDA